MERKQGQRFGILLVCLIVVVAWVTMPDGPMGQHSHVFDSNHPLMVKIAELEARIDELECSSGSACPEDTIIFIPNELGSQVLNLPGWIE